MHIIPAYMYKREILTVIDALILDDGYRYYSAVPDIERDALVILAMRLRSDRDLFDVIAECDDRDSTLSALMTYINHGGTERAYDLAEVMRKNTHQYFERSLDELFAERVEVLEQERKEEAGLHAVVDRTSGDVRWVR